jgi:hypothetical protein
VFLKNQNQTSLEKAIIEAKDVCNVPESKKECWVAWDIVEELSEAAANLKEKEKFKSTPPQRPVTVPVTVNFNKDADAHNDAYDADDDSDDDYDDDDYDDDDYDDDDYNDPSFDIDDSPIFDL